MTVGPGIAPGLLTPAPQGWHRALAGSCKLPRRYRRWGISPRPENAPAPNMMYGAGSGILEGMVRLEVASVAELISLKGVRFPSGSASISYPEITQKWSNKCHAFSDRRGPPWASSQQNSASRQVFLLPERYSYKIKVL